MRTALSTIFILIALAVPASAQDDQDDDMFERIGQVLVETGEEAARNTRVVYRNSERGTRVGVSTRTRNADVELSRSWLSNVTIRVEFIGDSYCREFVAESDLGYIGRFDRKGFAERTFDRVSENERPGVTIICIDPESSLEGMRSDPIPPRLEANSVATVRFNNREFRRR